MIKDYIIADHKVRVDIEADDTVFDSLLPSFVPFKADGEHDAPLLFTMRLERSLHMIPQDERRVVSETDPGNGVIRIETTEDKRYQITVFNLAGRPCALLVTSPQFRDCRCAIRGGEADRRFGLNSAMMMAYAFCAAKYDTLLVHASVVRHAGKAYAFTAESGVGKSTQTRNWLENIDGCDLINDDNPVIRLVEGQPVLYGTPWSGKTPCYRNVSAPLGAVMLVVRDRYNHVEPLATLQKFTTLLQACSAMRSDEDIYNSICDTVSRVVSATTMAALHCLPDAESALVCRRFLEGE